ERILVNSERSVPPNPARPDGGGRTGACLVVTAAMSDSPFAAVLPLRDELFLRRRLALARLGVPWLALAWLALLILGAPVFHAVRGQLHEGRLERGPDHGQLVQPHAMLERDIADLGRHQPADGQRAVAAARDD